MKLDIGWRFNPGDRLGINDSGMKLFDRGYISGNIALYLLEFQIVI